MRAYTENVILLEEDGKVVGFIKSAVVYKSEKMDSEEIATLVDPEFGVINRKA